MVLVNALSQATGGVFSSTGPQELARQSVFDRDRVETMPFWQLGPQGLVKWQPGGYDELI